MSDLQTSFKSRTEKELRDILGEPDEANKIGFVVCYNADKEWYISADTDGVDGGYEIKPLIDRYEKGYMECHHRSYESSMSACINNVFYKWSIIKCDISKLNNMIQSMSLYKSWNISGGAKGLKLKEEYFSWFNDPTKHIRISLIAE